MVAFLASEGPVRAMSEASYTTAVLMSLWRQGVGTVYRAALCVEANHDGDKP